ncbi:MAG: MFS transporter [Anaerolineales bacterium]|nr:MFS transporter [Anaerolineales bacterium]
MNISDQKTSEERGFPSIRIDISYSLLSLSTTIIWSIVDGWLLYFYLPPEGQGIPLVPVALFGAAWFMARVFNALLTPLVGYWSDHSHSRWGRRLPFIFLAGFPYLVFFVLIWRPPFQGEHLGNLVYLVTILVFHNVAQILVTIPYTALLPELAGTDRHRVRMTTWSAIFQLFGVVLAGMAGLLIARWGYFRMALVYAVGILPIMYLPFLVLREQHGRQIAVKERLGFWQSLAITLHNKAFLYLTAAGGCFWITTTFLMYIIPYIVTEMCLLGEAETVYFYLPAVLASLISYPVVMRLSGRFGKWKVFSGSMLASTFVLPGLMLIGPWWPIPLAAQGIIWIVLQAVVMSPAIMLPQTFAAEITDDDEKQTGQRREGAYYSAWSFLDQLVNGLAGALLPLLLLLGRSRLDPNGPLGVRSTGLIGGVLLFAAFLIFQKYPLKHLSVPDN